MSLLVQYGVFVSFTTDTFQSSKFKVKSLPSGTVSGGVGQDHVHHPFVWRNAKSFYCFLLWEKAGLRFQRILKSILHEKTTN